MIATASSAVATRRGGRAVPRLQASRGQALDRRRFLPDGEGGQGRVGVRNALLQSPALDLSPAQPRPRIEFCGVLRDKTLTIDLSKYTAFWSVTLTIEGRQMSGQFFRGHKALKTGVDENEVTDLVSLQGFREGALLISSFFCGWLSRCRRATGSQAQKRTPRRSLGPHGEMRLLGVGRPDAARLRPGRLRLSSVWRPHAPTGDHQGPAGDPPDPGARWVVGRTYPGPTYPRSGRPPTASAPRRPDHADLGPLLSRGRTLSLTKSLSADRRAAGQGRPGWARWGGRAGKSEAGAQVSQAPPGRSVLDSGVVYSFAYSRGGEDLVARRFP